MTTYPIFLIGLENRCCVVLGGGSEAERKVEGLLECKARVKLISATISNALRRYADDDRLCWIDRDYRHGDLRDAFLVIATGQDASIDALAWEEAENRGVLINVIDDVKHCNFIAGSVIRRGSLTLAVSTSGCAPALAVRLRQRLESEIGPEYALFLELLSALRKPLVELHADFGARRELWYQLVDSDILESLRGGRPDLALDRVSELAGERAADLLSDSWGRN